MDSEGRPVSAADVLAEGVEPWSRDVVPVSAVIVVAGLDPETGEEHLFIRHDSDASKWKHIGMLQVALDDLRDDCRTGSCDCD